jgi:c-di-GMP-binding flagellar brake protein YcgR
MKERRRSPRIEKALPLKLSDSGFDILTETTNISESGAYCVVSKPLALMTKLNLVLLVPIKKNRSRAIEKINCCGVVVRNEEVKDNGKYPYRVGICFSDLTEKDKKKLHSYVKSHLKQ